MNYALQVHESKHIFPLPDGLKELSSDIIREVLRHQPDHINGFIADYLETMLVVREHTRDTAGVICGVFEEGQFFDELYKTKGVTRHQANEYATRIQASWRGYVVRRKLAEWLKKKKKIDDDRERKRTLKIEELLDGMGITYEEATRAAGLIQSAYKESKRGRWISSDAGEIWLGESIPFGRRIREGDRAQGRFDKWEKEDFGDFFEMDTEGAIRYVWPRVGQLRKVLRDNLPDDVDIVDFFAMRDLQGQEQYSYLIRSQTKMEKRGTPIGFLIPVPRALVLESTPEVVFVKKQNAERMGSYTYVFKETVDREEVGKFDELFKAEAKASMKNEDLIEKFDYDPHWVLPRILVRIKTEYLTAMDDEVNFKSLSAKVVCEGENYVFRAETLEQTAKVVRYIMREECLTVEEALIKAANLSPYKVKETGRIFPVDSANCPDFIQRIEILPESNSGEDTNEMSLYEYIFVPPHMASSKKYPKGEPVMKIYMTRFQGYHSDYQGSTNLESKIFVMGPKLAAVNGRALTFESFFWNEFGEEAWYQLLYDIMCNKYEIEGEGEGAGEKSIEKADESEIKSKDIDEAAEVEGEEKTSEESGETFMGRGEATDVAKSEELQAPTEKSVEGEAAKEAKGEAGPAAKEKPETKEDEEEPEHKEEVNE